MQPNRPIHPSLRSPNLPATTPVAAPDSPSPIRYSAVGPKDVSFSQPPLSRDHGKVQPLEEQNLDATHHRKSVSSGMSPSTSSNSGSKAEFGRRELGNLNFLLKDLSIGHSVAFWGRFIQSATSAREAVCEKLARSDRRILERSENAKELRIQIAKDLYKKEACEGIDLIVSADLTEKIISWHLSLPTITTVYPSKVELTEQDHVSKKILLKNMQDFAIQCDSEDADWEEDIHLAMSLIQHPFFPPVCLEPISKLFQINSRETIQMIIGVFGRPTLPLRPEKSISQLSREKEEEHDAQLEFDEKAENSASTSRPNSPLRGVSLSTVIDALPGRNENSVEELKADLIIKLTAVEPFLSSEEEKINYQIAISMIYEHPNLLCVEKYRDLITKLETSQTEEEINSVLLEINDQFNLKKTQSERRAESRPSLSDE